MEITRESLPAESVAKAEKLVARAYRSGHSRHAYADVTLALAMAVVAVELGYEVTTLTIPAPTQASNVVPVAHVVLDFGYDLDDLDEEGA